MEQIAKYQNGNTTVSIFSDGTKIREYEDIAQPEFPESLDVKLTGKCDMNCSFCHESSTISGKHGDIDKLITVLDCLPAGVELAIGGGDALSHPNLINLLYTAKKRGWFCNLTVNQRHLVLYWHYLEFLLKEDLIKGLGISINSKDFTDIEILTKQTDNIVYHLIAGISQPEIIDELIKLGNCKVLILGYKQFGRGIKYYRESIDDNIRKWIYSIPKYIGKCTLTFDNLAIEQLKIKRLFTNDGWEKFYMGDDGAFTLYCDSVKQEFAISSTSQNRVSWNKMTLLEFFNSIKSEKRITNSFRS